MEQEILTVIEYLKNNHPNRISPTWVMYETLNLIDDDVLNSNNMDIIDLAELVLRLLDAL